MILIRFEILNVISYNYIVQKYMYVKFFMIRELFLEKVKEILKYLFSIDCVN